MKNMSNTIDIMKKITITSILIAAVLSMSGCVNIDDVNQPLKANPGETITIYINAHSNSSFIPGWDYPWGGVKIPNDWTVISCTYTGNYSGTMTEDAAIAASLESNWSSGLDYYWWGGKGPDTFHNESGLVVTTLIVQVGQPGSYLIDYRVGKSNSWSDNELDVQIEITALAPPSITSSAPESPVNDTYCSWTKFNVSVNQTVNVTWYLNETPQTSVNESVTEANYTFHAEYTGEHNISSVAENANGTDMQTWVWNVTADTTPPTAPTNLVHTDDAPSGYDNDNNTNISWSGSFDTYSSVIYRIYRDGVLNGSRTSTTYTFTDETEGLHEYNVSVIDSSGNINTTNASVTVIVDYTNPVIHNVSLSDTTPVYNQKIVVSVNVNDTNMGSVTAGSTALTHQSGMLWNGTISAGYGTNTVTVTAYDNASNTATNTSLSYTGPDVPRDSGGGGIGVSSSNEPGNVEETLVLRIYLKAGDSSTYNFNNVVTSVEVTPDRTYGRVAARIEILHGQPASITSDPPAGELYKYVNVFVGTPGWYEGKLSNSVINFEIPESWFEENNIDPTSVVMYRQDNGKWQPLTTTMTGPAGGNYMYSSPTPGFSTFIILGQVGDSGAGEPADAPDSGTESDSTPTPEATSTKGTPGFGILVGIMGVMIAVYSRRK